jgi:hypothetical protein
MSEQERAPEEAPLPPSEEEARRPRLTALIFSDYATQSVDGKYILIGVFDRVWMVPSQAPPFVPSYQAYIRLAGLTPGRLEVLGFNPDGTVGFQYNFVLDRPGEKAHEPGSFEWLFPFFIQPNAFGIHWFEVRFRGEILGRAPLFVGQIGQEPHATSTNPGTVAHRAEHGADPAASAPA